MKRAGMEGSASPDGTRTEVTVASEADVGFDDDLYYSNASSHLKAVNDMFIGVLKAQ
jgi:hypothetical protein